MKIDKFQNSYSMSLEKSSIQAEKTHSRKTNKRKSSLSHTLSTSCLIRLRQSKSMRLILFFKISKLHSFTKVLISALFSLNRPLLNKQEKEVEERSLLIERKLRMNLALILLLITLDSVNNQWYQSFARGQLNSKQVG